MGVRDGARLRHEAVDAEEFDLDGTFMTKSTVLCAFPLCAYLSTALASRWRDPRS